MDRRRFLKSLLLTPTLTPLARTAVSYPGRRELYLIENDPQNYLPALLEEVLPGRRHTGRRFFTFLSPHPRAREIAHALRSSGWHQVESRTLADIRLTFSALGKEVSPSFTMIDSGRIRDIRGHRLQTVWEEINTHRPPSASLTHVSVRSESNPDLRGDRVVIYQNGRRVGSLLLDSPQQRTFASPAGPITARVEGGKAEIAASACRRQICRHTPPVSLAGERIICAPGHFLLEVRGSSVIDTVIG